MHIKRIHHVAYRCKNAKETVEWYGKYLNMKFVLAIAEDEVKWDMLNEWDRTKKAPRHAAGRAGRLGRRRVPNCAKIRGRHA